MEKEFLLPQVEWLTTLEGPNLAKEGGVGCSHSQLGEANDGDHPKSRKLIQGVGEVGQVVGVKQVEGVAEAIVEQMDWSYGIYEAV